MTTETAQGTVFEVNQTGTWIECGELETFDGLTHKQTVIDSTSLRSTARRRRAAKLVDAGPFTATIHWDPADAGQIRLRTLLTTGAAENFRVTLQDSITSHVTFAGIVSEFKVSGKIGDKIMATIQIDIDGDITGI